MDILPGMDEVRDKGFIQNRENIHTTQICGKRRIYFLSIKRFMPHLKLCVAIFLYQDYFQRQNAWPLPIQLLDQDEAR